MIKPKLFILLFSVLFISCAEEVTISTEEANKQTLLTSKEFAEMKSSYNDYNEFKLTEIQRILNEQKSGKISEEQFNLAKDMYLENCVKRFKVVIEKQKNLKAKFPDSDLYMPYQEVLQSLTEQ